MDLRKGKQKKFNIWCAAALFLCLLCAFPRTSSAHGLPDTSAEGSVSVELTYDGLAVAGGEIAVFKAGDIAVNDGNCTFRLSEDFLESGLSLDIEGIKASELKALAGALAAFADENEITGITAEVGSDGKASVSGLCAGLYLVVQTQAAEGHEAFAPFLVSVPMYDETADEYIYDVDASPKVSLEKAQEETTVVPEETTQASAEDDDPDVQTGDASRLMMWAAFFWASALIIVILAAARRRDRKK